MDPFGCVKNQVDAENMMAFLDGAGWVSASDPGTADIIIVNSCGFIESAKRESINAVLSWKKNYPGKKILLSGCLVRRYEKELAESLPEADVLFDSEDLSGIVPAAGKLAGEPPEAAGIPRTPETPEAGKRPLLSLPGSAYVKISEGCDNRCSFCAIPLIRGGLKSRGSGGILAECRALLDRGVRELCLIGQDTASYGRDTAQTESRRSVPADSIERLLTAISGLAGDFWVRLLYIHPDNFPFSVLDIMAADRRILPYFDIPFQHGSARILAAMNRRGSAETYLDLAARIRDRLPGAVIRSTFMTGFPGENAGDFEQLLDFQEKIRLDWLGVFDYSREEDTPACSMEEQIPKKISRRRRRIIEKRQIPITGKNLDRFVGGTWDVLVEERLEGGTQSGPLYLGRLYCQALEVDGSAVIVPENGGEDPLRPGTFIRGLVTGRSGVDLTVKKL
ncbi:MAG: 30S ribosomal protein S12 methylthiotransferase RimO [Treponema sp.]|jgi:ribosomal protein S12 methylthiotransferase|nr:30S ribosomal protein S12 methylthiotransferase RimO [Treponema sp.]